MKKILNISVIAALAILPMAANATPVAGDPANIATNPPEGQTAVNVTASAAPKYQLAEANSAVDGVVATAGYVKGAYNAAIKAINKVADTANSAVQSVTEGATNGTVAVNGTDVAVHGLGSAAYTDSTAYATAAQGTKADTAVQTVQLNGTALTETDGVVNVTAVQSVTTGTANGTVKVDNTDVAVAGWATKQDALNETQMNAVDSGINSTKVGQYDQLVTDSANYATKTGVETTVTNAFTGATATLTNSNVTKSAVEGTATISVVDTWGAIAPAATGVSVDLTNTSVVQGLTGTAAVNSGTVAYPTNP